MKTSEVITIFEQVANKSVISKGFIREYNIERISISSVSIVLITQQNSTYLFRYVISNKSLFAYCISYNNKEEQIYSTKKEVKDNIIGFIKTTVPFITYNRKKVTTNILCL